MNTLMMAIAIAGLLRTGWATDKSPNKSTTLAKATAEMKVPLASATVAADAGKPLPGIYPAYRETPDAGLQATKYAWEWRQTNGLTVRVNAITETQAIPTPPTHAEWAAAEAARLVTEMPWTALIRANIAKMPDIQTAIYNTLLAQPQGVTP